MQNITNEMSFVKVAYKVDIKLFFYGPILSII